MTAIWLPVITALVAALLGIIPAAALYIRVLLEQQTAALKAHITVMNTPPPAQPAPAPRPVTAVTPLGPVIPPGTGVGG